MRQLYFIFRRLHAEHSSGFKEVAIRFVLTVVSLAVGILIGISLKLALKQPVDGTSVAISLSVSAIVSLCVLFVLQLVNLPHNTIYNSYNALRDRAPELLVELNDDLRRDLERLRVHLHDVSGTGELWPAPERFRIAVNLVKSFGPIHKYWATSTDNPYETLAISKEFYRRTEATLRGADVRRLLVFPREQLLNDLKSRATACDDLLTFIEWQQSGGYKLRYWSNTISELRNTMQMTIGARPDEPVLVDVAFVEGKPVFRRGASRLLFGQAARAGDDQKLNGPGMVRVENGIPAMYADWFESTWNRHERDFECAAQLAYWAKLYQLRRRIQTRPRDQTCLTGDDFLEFVDQRLRKADKLLAVDVADEPAHWIEDPAYSRFHDAMNTSADRGRGPHARVFVIAHCMVPSVATRFVHKRVIDLLQHGVDVFFYRRKDLVEKNIAAGDHIIADDWCFYLAPTDRFREGAVSADANKADTTEDLSLFEEQFERLAVRDAAWIWYAGFKQPQAPEAIKSLAGGLIERLSKEV